MFSGDEKVWIILESGKTESPEALRKRFLKNFQIKGRKSQNYKSHHFQRVINQFKKNEGKPPRISGRPVAARTPEAKAAVKESIQTDPKASIRSTARQLNFSKTTTHKILKNDLKLKPTNLTGHNS